MRFYADPKRYCGPNQRAVVGDEYNPRGDEAAYYHDVNRDGGEIARNALAAMRRVSKTDEGRNAVIEALRDIVSWKNDTLGERKDDDVLTPSERASREAFDRGARMAFYGCADRASRALTTGGN